MSKKKAKDLVLESPESSVEESDKNITLMDSEEFLKYPITMPISGCNNLTSSSSSSTPLRGETINFLLVDDASCFDNTKSEPTKTTPKKISPERKRRLRLLK